MKLFNSRNQASARVNTRFVWMAGGPESAEGESGLLPENPLRFGYADIAPLKQGLKDRKLTGKEQRGFSQMINFQLKKVERETTNSSSSRTLFTIFRDSQLNNLLTATQRRAIEALLSKERKEIALIAKTNPEHWSEDQAIRVARTYRSLRSKVNTESLTIDESMREVGDNLKAYGVRLSEKAELAPKERLFVLELVRLFPSSTDWKSDRVFASLKSKSDQVRINLIAKIEEKTAIPYTAKKYWDLLVDDVDATEVSPDLKAFLKRNQEVETLSQIALRFENSEGRLLSVKECQLLLDLKTSTEDVTVYEFSHTELEDSYQEGLEKARKEIDRAEKIKTEKEAELTDLPSDVLIARLPKDSKIHEEIEKNKTLFESEPTDAKDKSAKANIVAKVKQELLPVESRDESLNFLGSQLKSLEKKLESEKLRVDKESKAFSNSAEVAGNVLNDYEKALKKRIKNKTVVSSDTTLLLELSNDEVHQLGGESLVEKKDVIIEIRKTVEAKLGAALKLDLTADTIKDEAVEILDKNLNYATALPLVIKEGIEGLDNMSAFEQRQTIESVIHDIRGRVLNKISEKTKTSGNPVIDNFIDHYHREHHRLSDNSIVKDSLNHTAKIEKKKDANKEKYEHAFEKVQSLFAEGERSHIIVSLNKILKPTHDGEKTLTEIEGTLDASKNIFEYNDTEIKAISAGIKKILKPKVTSHYGEDVNLDAAVKGLVNSLSQGQAQEISQKGMKTSLESLNTTTGDHNWMTLEDTYYLSQVTYPISREVNKNTETFGSTLDSLVGILKTGDEFEIARQVLDLKTDYVKNLKPDLQKSLNEFEAELSVYFKPLPEGARDYLNEIKAHFLELDTLMNRLFEAKDHLSGFDESFKTTARVLEAIRNLFDIDTGDIGDSIKEDFDTTITNSAETQAFIKDELELFGVGGVEKARRNFENKRKEQQAIVDEYKTALGPVEKLMERDLKNFNESDFKLRHQMSRADARKRLQAMKLNLKDGEDIIKIFNGEDHAWMNCGRGEVFDQWMGMYKDPEQHGNALKFMNIFDVFGKELKSEKFPEMTEEMIKWNKDYKENMPLIPFMKNKYRITVTWYSLKSIYMMAKYAFEQSTRQRERRNEQMMATLGEKIFGDSRLGREFKREANDKEKERVDQWKGSYGDYDVPQLKKVIEGVTHLKDKDEARAAIELLIEKGELSIDSPIFLNVLNRISGRTIFDQSDIAGYAQDKDALLRKVGEVFTDIWDRPTWIQTKEDFTSKYDSAMKQNEGDIKHEVFTGGVDSYLIRSLDNWAKGTPDDDFERPRFEQYLRGAIESGVMNGYPGGGDRRLFYMIKAVTTKNPNTGETLLGMGAVGRFADLMANIPYLDGLDDGSTWKKDGRVVPEGTPGAQKRSWNYEDIHSWAKYFDHIPVGSLSFSEIKSDPTSQIKKDLDASARKWFNEVLVPTGDAQDRIAKVPLDKIDHDDMGNLPLLVSAEKLRNFLNYNSGDVAQLTEKQMLNLMTSFELNYEDTVNYLKTLEREYKHSPGYKDFQKEQLSRFGEMLRTYFMMSQQLAGNWDFEGSVGSVVMSDNEWLNMDGGVAYKKINERIFKLTEEEDVKDLVDKRYQIQKTSLTRGKLTSEHSKQVDTIERLFKDADSAFKDHGKLAQMAGVTF